MDLQGLLMLMKILNMHVQFFTLPRFQFVFNIFLYFVHFTYYFKQFILFLFHCFYIQCLYMLQIGDFQSLSQCLNVKVLRFDHNLYCVGFSLVQLISINRFLIEHKKGNGKHKHKQKCFILETQKPGKQIQFSLHTHTYTFTRTHKHSNTHISHEINEPLIHFPQIRIQSYFLNQH